MDIILSFVCIIFSMMNSAEPAIQARC